MASAHTTGRAALRFRRDVAFRVSYEDETDFGSPIGQRADDSVRAIFQPVVQYVKRHGPAGLIAQSHKLLGDCVAAQPFRRLCESVDSLGWRLRPEILYPDPQLTRPAMLTVHRADSASGLELSLRGEDWPQVHKVIAHLCSGGAEIEPLSAPVDREFGSIFERGGLLERSDDYAPRVAEALAETDVTFTGHNAVMVRTPSTSVLIDPFLFPRSSQHPASYQPLTVRDLGPISAVLITHSHPDHFDPATLLQIPRDTLMVVPECGAGGESLLSQDMELRLRELGFEHCSVLPWNQSLRVGDIEVHALPFYGEQPSDSEVLHPEVRNAGNTYITRTPTFSAAFVADSGRDAAGDVRKVASEWRRAFGPVDVLFTGYRGWLTYPAQLLFSSVSRYLLFVPPELWGTRLQLMNNISDAIDVAERWGARYLVPYGDGGAPWHWQIGLGPRLDGTGAEDPSFDPFPERVVQECRARVRFPSGATGGSAVETLLLRPGESLKNVQQSAEIVRLEGHTWPYTA